MGVGYEHNHNGWNDYSHLTFTKLCLQIAQKDCNGPSVKAYFLALLF